MAFWELAASIRRYGSAELDHDAVLKLRDDLGLCSYGLGHWTHFCDDDCSAVVAE